NCAGIVHLREGSRFAATFLRDLPPGGGLAFVSQSGAIAEEVIAKANEIELKFGTIISLGNAMRIGVEDYLEFLGADETVSAIVLYIESLEDPHRFREVARRIAAKKPVIAFMGGRTAAGAAAATAHTGAVANDDSTIEAFCRDSGVLRVRSLREMLLASKGFGTFPMGLGRRALVLSNSGGPGVICTDAAALAGLELPDLPNSMATIMRAELPGEAAVANPIDLLADAREERFAMTLDLALEHARDTYDAILMIHVVPFMVDPVPVIAAMAERARATDMPILHAMMGTLPDKDSWFATMETAGVPMFNNVEEMAACAGMLAAYPALRVSAEEAMRRNDDAPVLLKGRG
ncbi:MAG: hypothetical protein HOL85_21540, partial [Rhodospirillaceae bacterium]|nr:hypothetical protein [Rhodospirillaceae bacterium]